ncbi:hypothetical protein NIES4074_60650 (plasmid) [Cylindrospermum sp. NIES-4074]|nr:hypothetical protein NIES4074_60650 [Cylindrospermum sp. NIES-4074]
MGNWYNILVENGAIAGIIDWGEITSGDIATDLASIWMLFGDPKARSQALAEYQGKRILFLNKN